MFTMLKIPRKVINLDDNRKDKGDDDDNAGTPKNDTTWLLKKGLNHQLIPQQRNQKK